MKAIALLLSLFALSAHAEDRKWYAGVEAGRSDVHDQGVCVLGDPCIAGSGSDDSTAWGLHAGYRLNSHFALEYGYRRIFDEKVSTLDPKVATHDFSLLAFTPEFHGVSAFGRVGVSRMHDDGGAAVLPDRNVTRAHYGLGLDWHVSERVNLRIERIEYADTYFSRGHVLLVGIGFQFP